MWVNGEVQLTGRNVSQDFKIYTDATAAGVAGTNLSLNGEDKIILSTSGTATSLTLHFRAKGPNGVNCYVLGKKITDSAGTIVTAAQATGLNEVWEIEGLAGYTLFAPWLNAIAGGNITVTVKTVV